MTKPLITELDIHAMRDVLESIRSQCSPENHTRMADMVEVLAEMMAMVRESDADDDTPLDEEFLAQAIERVSARKSK